MIFGSTLQSNHILKIPEFVFHFEYRTSIRFRIMLCRRMILKNSSHLLRHPVIKWIVTEGCTVQLLCMWESVYPYILSMGQPTRHHLVLYYLVRYIPTQHLVRDIPITLCYVHVDVMFNIVFIVFVVFMVIMTCNTYSADFV